MTVFDKQEKGFTLVEAVVTVAIFSFLILSIAGLFSAIVRGITYYREKTTISSLAEQYLEVARNLPYSEVGTQNGNPHGPLPDSVSPLSVNFNGVDCQIYYVVNSLQDPAETNTGIQDYKQVKLYIKNLSDNTTNSFLTTVAPISLASMATGGVLSIQVIDKSWQPISSATIHITNTSISPSINLTRISDSSGRWNEVGLPSDENYHIVVTKNGYSTDQTYSRVQYHDPYASNPDAPVLTSQVQQVTFKIDRLSNLAFHTLSQTCQAISGVALNITGTKEIRPGTSKFNQNFSSDGGGGIYPTSTSTCSNSCGAVSCCLEWDTYAPTLTGNIYMVYGTSPVQSVDLTPDTSQSFNFILGNKTTNALLVVVKDSSGNPAEGAKVELINAGLNYDVTKYTGGSVWSQNDWSGGSGQADWSLANQYDQDDGNISNNAIPLALRLAPGAAPYETSGSLVSSTFDTGTTQTSYTALTWQATTESQVTSVKFQIATSNCPNGATDYPGCVTGPGSWNFTGPDGTVDTYYDTSGSTISSTNNNKRYVRYKAVLSTTDSQKTPMLSSVSVNYVSGCPTPGQVMFPGLTANSNYKIVVNDDANQTYTGLDVNGYFIFQATLP